MNLAVWSRMHERSLGGISFFLYDGRSLLSYPVLGDPLTGDLNRQKSPSKSLVYDDLVNNLGVHSPLHYMHGIDSSLDPVLPAVNPANP